MQIALEKVKNVEKNKVLRMKSSIVENVPTPLETLFMPFRAPQRPYIKKSEISKINYLIN